MPASMPITKTGSRAHGLQIDTLKETYFFIKFFKLIFRHWQLSMHEGLNNSSEMDSWKDLLSRFLGTNLSLEFLSGFLPSFFCSTKCYSWLDLSFLVLQFFRRILKTREEYGFLLPVEGTVDNIDQKIDVQKIISLDSWRKNMVCMPSTHSKHEY